MLSELKKPMTQDDYARNNARGRCLQITEPNWASLNLIGLYRAESGNDTDDDSDGSDSFKTFGNQCALGHSTCHAQESKHYHNNFLV
jgi:hypothetical protein